MILGLLRRLLEALGGGGETDEALFAAHVGGDPRAFEQLFQRYSGPIARLMRAQVRKDEDVRDLVQLTFLHLHRARADFRPGARLRPWLYTIAMNLRREHWRRLGRRREDAVEELEGRGSVEPEDVTRGETARQVRTALGSLPASQREVIELHWFEGLPFAEVAAVVGSTEGAVKVRAHRGYRKLQELLGDLDTAPVTAEGGEA